MRILIRFIVIVLLISLIGIGLYFGIKSIFNEQSTEVVDFENNEVVAKPNIPTPSPILKHKMQLDVSKIFVTPKLFLNKCVLPTTQTDPNEKTRTVSGSVLNAICRIVTDELCKNNQWRIPNNKKLTLSNDQQEYIAIILACKKTNDWHLEKYSKLKSIVDSKTKSHQKDLNSVIDNMEYEQIVKEFNTYIKCRNNPTNENCNTVERQIFLSIYHNSNLIQTCYQAELKNENLFRGTLEINIIKNDPGIIIIPTIYGETKEDYFRLNNGFRNCIFDVIKKTNFNIKESEIPESDSKKFIRFVTIKLIPSNMKGK
ncbi:MAG: hypothetical protein HQK49_13110 [Oligoflexia bacterium]|nr:hypothetical protein [Oligoflexia bacterium]